MSDVPEAVSKVHGAIDDRFGGNKFLAKAIKKVFPDHWSFLLGEIAMYSFFVIIATGVFLTFFFVPSMNDTVYNGSYLPLRGVHMSEAYNSALRISFDVRGGLLMRQMHHWATIVFLAAILAHMLRNFLTGAFRKPRELNWIIGVILFLLVLVNGLFGYSLPDDLLSGTGIRLLEGVLLSVPVVGTYITFFVFGGQFPGHEIIPRLYIVHVLIIPGILLALIPLHALVLTWRQTHTQFPGLGRTNHNVIGKPFFPVFAAKTTAFFLWVTGIIALLATFFQINPIWLFGPYTPDDISAGSQPDWYMGFLEGSLRIMPNWESNFAGHTISWNVLIPGLGPLGIVVTALLLYPFIERWITGDRETHHLLDRPRDVPVRTGIGFAGIAFYGTLWAAGGNDIIAKTFNIQLYWTTWGFRALVVVAPVLAFIIARRICIGLQARDRALLEHGYESGIITRLPSGEYVEREVPLDESARAVLSARRVPRALPGSDALGIPAPGARHPIGMLRYALNRAYLADVVKVPAGNGHSEHAEHAELE
jgi:ubiquinol-cytochrome c reductase cytochrome b subunit